MAFIRDNPVFFDVRSKIAIEATFRDDVGSPTRCFFNLRGKSGDVHDAQSAGIVFDSDIGVTVEPSLPRAYDPSTRHFVMPGNRSHAQATA